MSRPRAVIDTNVLVSALWKPASTPARVLDAWHKDKFVLCFSREVLGEYHNTLARIFAGGGSGTMPRHIAAELAAIESKGESIDDLPDLSGSIPEDPSDEKFLECAVAAQAVIVSGDDDLLRRDGFEDVTVIKPADFLRELNL